MCPVQATSALQTEKFCKLWIHAVKLIPFRTSMYVFIDYYLLLLVLFYCSNNNYQDSFSWKHCEEDFDELLSSLKQTHSS